MNFLFLSSVLFGHHTLRGSTCCAALGVDKNERVPGSLDKDEVRQVRPDLKVGGPKGSTFGVFHCAVS